MLKFLKRLFKRKKDNWYKLSMIVSKDDKKILRKIFNKKNFIVSVVDDSVSNELNKEHLSALKKYNGIDNYESITFEGLVETKEDIFARLDALKECNS